MSDRPLKQVLVYRRDLGMRKGKMAAQIAHSVMKGLVDNALDNVVGYVVRGDDGNEYIVRHPRLLVVPCTEDEWGWLQGKFTKIVLNLPSEADLLLAYAEAKARSLPCCLVTDAGATEFKKPCDRCGGKGKGEPVYPTLLPGRGVVGTGYPGQPCRACDGSGKVPHPTNTAIAIGPGPVDLINEITGQEGMFKGKIRMP
jgi:PTH2 family peptidyl-tRNA hydrolase